MTQPIIDQTPPLHIAIIGCVSVIAAIFVGFTALGWFFKDGDDSTNSMQEFTEEARRPYGSPFLTVFGVWLLVSGGAGYVCFMILLKAWHYFRHA